jgi:hypothetical protein
MLDNIIDMINNDNITLEMLRYLYNLCFQKNNIELGIKYLDLSIYIYNELDEHELKYYLIKLTTDLNLLLKFLKNNDNLPFYYKMDYLNELNEYCQNINEIPINILYDSKKEYRYFCYKCLNKLKNENSHLINTSYLNLDLYNESILIEFRILPHIELLLRNTINKLGIKWSHTVVCGNLNYDYIFNICAKIGYNIKIIKLDINECSINDYNYILTNSNFWNLFSGNKLLIYQEDTFIFNSNINDFLDYDYIGAVWPIESENNNNMNVGNGGFSLRTKKIMLEIINTIPNNELINEDIYFTNAMIYYNIGTIANKEIAQRFSSEYFNSDSLGGHCFFIYDYKWKKKIYNNLFNI